jgi:hypothetical protein
MISGRPVMKTAIHRLAAGGLIAASLLLGSDSVARAGEPNKGDTKQVPLGRDVALELVYIPPGGFGQGPFLLLAACFFFQ